MSEAPNTSTRVTPPTIVNVTPPYPAYNHHQIRDYRKGNWTPEETLILITAKKLDDERRVTTSTTTSNSRAGGELRWKWVENYCWSAGCLRSQNQCNDKWDNLLRDYKKVRDYQLQAHNQNRQSYWAMDKTQRKQRNLPSNMQPNIYEALNDVVQRKHTPNKQQQNLAVLPPPPPPLPPPAPLPPEVPPPPPHPPASEPQGEGDEDENESTKRRRVRDVDDIGSSIINSTELLSQTLKHYDKNKEKRHNQLMELEQQRLHLEETRNQVNSQGIAALITSISKLSDAIHVLISEKRT